MKAKRMIIIGLAVSIMCIFLAGQAIAAQKWRTVTPLQANTFADGSMSIYVVMDNKYRTFFASTGQESEMLAIALTAITATYNLSILVDFAVDGDTMNGMKLLSQ